MSKRDERRHEQIAELGPSVVFAGERPVRRESVARATEQRVAATRVRPDIAAGQRPNRLPQQT